MIDARVAADDVGIRFDFDRRARLVTPSLRRVRRVRNTHWGLRGIGFELAPGSGVALVGPTGSGKTTLLRVLAGVIPPDAGELTVEGRVSSLLATEAGVGLQLTGRENAQLLGVLAGMSLVETRASLDRIAELAQLGEAFEHPVHTFSQGMRARLHFAVIQAVKPQIVLLDEVFEALDHEFRGQVEEYARGLRADGGIVVAAGHDHTALDRICPDGLLLEQGRIRLAGSFEEVIRRYRGAEGVAEIPG